MCEFVATRWECGKYRIERTTLLGVKESYAIRDGLNCMNKDGEFEYEPMPGGRDEDFYFRCRFNSFDEAVSFFKSHNPLVNVGRCKCWETSELLPCGASA